MAYILSYYMYYISVISGTLSPQHGAFSGLRMEERQRQNYPLNGSRDTDEKYFVKIEKRSYLLTIAA